MDYKLLLSNVMTGTLLMETDAQINAKLKSDIAVQGLYQQYAILFVGMGYLHHLINVMTLT